MKLRVGGEMEAEGTRGAKLEGPSTIRTPSPPHCPVPRDQPSKDLCSVLPALPPSSLRSAIPCSASLGKVPCKQNAFSLVHVSEDRGTWLMRGGVTVTASTLHNKARGEESVPCNPPPLLPLPFVHHLIILRFLLNAPIRVCEAIVHNDF